MYTTERILTAPSISPSLLRRIISLRLEALQSAPASYHSNYDHESRFTDTQWIKRLTELERHDFVCKYTLSADDQNVEEKLGDKTEVERPWVGMFTMLGPLSKDQYAAPRRQGPELGSDRHETRWYLVGLYLHADHRGREASIAIHEAILDFARSWTDENLECVFDDTTGLERPKLARVGGTLGSKDPILKALYEALGSFEVGRVNKAEALKIAGNEELISDDDLRTYSEIVVMETVVDC